VCVCVSNKLPTTAIPFPNKGGKIPSTFRPPISKNQLPALPLVLKIFFLSFLFMMHDVCVRVVVNKIQVEKTKGMEWVWEYVGVDKWEEEKRRHEC